MDYSRVHVGDLVTAMYELYLETDVGLEQEIVTHLRWIPGEIGTVLEVEEIEGLDVVSVLVGTVRCSNVLEEEVKVLSKYFESSEHFLPAKV